MKEDDHVEEQETEDRSRVSWSQGQDEDNDQGLFTEQKTRKAIVKKVSETLKKTKPDRLVEYDTKLTQVGD